MQTRKQIRTLKRKQDRSNRRVHLFCCALAGVFLLTLAGLALANGLTPDRSFSDKENRMLAQRPDLSMGRVTDGRFMSEYETYVNDQFVLRDFWIKVKSTTDLAVGKRESNGVYLGKGSRLMEQFQAPEAANLAQTLSGLQAFAARHADLEQFALIAPTAVNVYRDDLPLWAPAEDQNAALDPLYAGMAAAGIQTIDVRGAFDAAKGDGLYYRTDHHWTTGAAYLAFQTAAPFLGLDAGAVTYERHPVTEDFQGTLASKSGFLGGVTESIEVYFPQSDIACVVTYVEEQVKTASPYDSQKLATKDAYAVFLGGNHALIDIQTSAETDRKLLLVKDSYANCFLPFLLPYYQEIVVVDPRYYYDSLDTLLEDYGLSQVLYLYNANTFFQDTALKLALEPPAEPE